MGTSAIAPDRGSTSGDHARVAAGAKPYFEEVDGRESTSHGLIATQRIVGQCCGSKDR